MAIDHGSVEYIFDYVEELCGIALDTSKSYLIEARLSKLVKKYGVNDPVALVNLAKNHKGEEVRRSLIEAMTTRETYFFRDGSPFDAFQFKALPEMLDVKMRSRQKRLRIWSAAASTGQEACSLGILIHEMIPDIASWDIQILATDISEDALERGRLGVYSALEVERGLPKHLLTKYFTQKPAGYHIAPHVHKLIRFQQMNLLAPFNFPSQFDIIFCRNVAIYFEKKVKVQLFRRMLPLLPSYGYLFVGASESLFECGPEFRPMAHCNSTFYQPNLAQTASTATATSSSLVTPPSQYIPPTPRPATKPAYSR